MNSSITVIRAVAGEIAHRVYVPILIIVIVLTAILIGLVLWLSTISLWWLLLLIPVLIAVVIAGTILTVTRIILATLTPSQTKKQRKEVKKFTDKILAVSELTQTPKFILLFRVVRDALAPKKAGYVESLVSETVSLRQDFNDLRRSFE
jgi:hypothetical protein